MEMPKFDRKYNQPDKYINTFYVTQNYPKDSPYPMTHDELKFFMVVYIQCVFNWIKEGFVYKIPFPRMGSIKLFKTRKVQGVKGRIIKKHLGSEWIPRVQWINKRFMWRALWDFTFNPKIVKGYYNDLESHIYKIYRLDNDGDN
jgi:hypothetical protein